MKRALSHTRIIQLITGTSEILVKARAVYVTNYVRPPRKVMQAAVFFADVMHYDTVLLIQFYFHYFLLFAVNKPNFRLARPGNPADRV
jgi:hypothetical protein